MYKTLINTGKSNDDIARTHFDSEEKEKAREKKPKKQEKEFLVYAVDLGGPRVSGEARLHIAGKNYKTIATYPEVIKSMCFTGNEIYFAAGTCIYTTEKKIAKRDGTINALCSHIHLLHDAGDYEAIFTEVDEKEKPKINGKVTALCSYDGQLYSSHFTEMRYHIGKPFKGDLMQISKSPIKSMQQHEEDLYYASGNKIRILEEAETRVRPKQVNALCSWNGKLIDAGNYTGICDTKTDKKIINTDKPITAMCTVSKTIAEWMIKNV